MKIMKKIKILKKKINIITNNYNEKLLEKKNNKNNLDIFKIPLKLVIKMPATIITILQILI